MMRKYTLITVVFAPYSSQMHYSASLPTPIQSLELYLIGAQNLGPVPRSDSSFELWAQWEAQHFEKSNRPLVALYILSFTVFISLYH